jgi:hypothetical protein
MENNALDIHHAPKLNLSTVAQRSKKPLPLVMLPVHLGKTQIVLDSGRATSTLHAMIFLIQKTTRVLGYLSPRIPSIVVLILLMQQTHAICPAPLVVQQNALSAKHAMEILHVVVGTPFIVVLRGMMHQVNVPCHVRQV